MATTELRTVELVLKGLADATRLRVVGVLFKGEASVAQMCATLHLPKRKAEVHLAYLTRVGLVKREKRDKVDHYSLVSGDDEAANVLRVLCPLVTRLSVVRADMERLDQVSAALRESPLRVLRTKRQPYDC